MKNFEKWRKKVLTQIRGEKSKYNAKKIETEDGVFDSLKEYRRWLVLKPMAASGEIRDLKRQVRFKLLDQQRDKDGKLLRGLYYVADFVYFEGEEQIVEDVNGDKTEAYQIKKKLMLKILGITIKET